MELSKIGLLLFKAESTYGTDAAPDAANNNIACVRGQVTLEPGNNAVARDILDGGFQRVKGVNTNLTMGLKFRTEVRGNRTTGAVADISKGAIANAIEIDALLRCCDLAATYVPETSLGARDGHVYYSPTIPASDGVSGTAYFYSQGKLYKLVGCKGDFSLSLQGGRFGFIDWDFKGRFLVPVDSSIPGSPTFLDCKPPTWEGVFPPIWPTATVDSALDTFTITAHGLQNGDRVQLGGTTAPAPLVLGTWYFVIAATANSFKLALTQSGTAVDLTTTGTGVTFTSANTLEYDSFVSAVCSKLDFKLGNAITLVEDANSPYGIYGFRKTDRASSISIDPESVKEATHPFWADYVSARSKNLNTKWGTLSGNKCSLFAKTTISKKNYEDRSGRRIDNLQLDVVQDTLGQAIGSDFVLKFF